MSVPKKKTVQAQLIADTMAILLRDGFCTLETVKPKPLKEALSRYKQENGISGQLHFNVDAKGFDAKTGDILYALTIAFAKF